MTWVMISKDEKGDNFYPADMIGNRLDLRLSYSQARKMPDTFWKDKEVVFHMVWKDKGIHNWQDFIGKVRKNANKFIVEFDADNHFPNLNSLDKFYESGAGVYKKLQNSADNFIWEFPPQYYPFSEPKNLLPLCMYDKTREKNIDPKSKNIDAVVIIDQTGNNAPASYTILEKLHNSGYKVWGLFLSDVLYRRFSKLKPPFQVSNTKKFTDKSIDHYIKLLTRTKTVVDLSYRFTNGRMVYDSIYYNAIPIFPRSYGAQVWIADAYSVDTYMLNFDKAYSTIVTTIDNYINDINVVRTKGRDYSIEKFIRNLKEWKI